MVWRSSTEIAGRSSQARPEIAFHAGQVHMAFLAGGSNQVLYSTFDNDHGWSEAEAISGRTSQSPPALAVHDGKLHMAFRGGGSDEVFHSVLQDGRWSRADKIRGRTSQAEPALASHAGQLHMAFLGGSDPDVLHSVHLGNGTWSDAEPIPDRRSRRAPSLVSHRGELHMAFLANDSDDVLHSASPDGGTWTRAQRIQGRTSEARPALATLADKLHMAFLGGHGDDYFHSVYDDAAHSGSDAVQLRHHEASSGPSLAAGPNWLMMAYTNDSDDVEFRLNFLPGCTVLAFPPRLVTSNGHRIVEALGQWLCEDFENSGEVVTVELKIFHSGEVLRSTTKENPSHGDGIHVQVSCDHLGLLDTFLVTQVSTQLSRAEETSDFARSRELCENQ